MTERGYLRDSGASKRLRFVKTGYDADDESVPPNKVIFDSNSLGTLSVLEVGEKVWTTSLGTGPDPLNSGAMETIRTWDYGFTPLCTFQFDVQNDGYWGPCIYVSPNSLNGNKILVSATGISVFLFWAFPARPMRLRWQAYRMPAT